MLVFFIIVIIGAVRRFRPDAGIRLIYPHIRGPVGRARSARPGARLTQEEFCDGDDQDKDGTEIYYKDWGSGQPVVFSHGWPLSADAWDAQMVFLGERGYRVIAHDRRGHGRSSQPWTGNDMDSCADDLAELTAKLDLKDAIHVGHSTGGGEVARYIGRHGTKRVAKAVLLGAVPPLDAEDRQKSRKGFRSRFLTGFVPPRGADRSQFFLDLTIAVLRLQPARRQSLGRRALFVLAAGHDVRPQGRARLHQGVFRNRLH